jgi:DNA-binding transcriptional MocR family regulator
MPRKATQYENVVRRMRHLIENGVLRVGDRLPSLRRLSDELHVSINTVKEAYWRLENQNYITAVPQSGFYVRKQPLLSPAPAAVDPAQLDPQEVTLCQIFGAYQAAGQCTPEIRLAVAHMDQSFWPSETLGRYFQEAARNHPEEAFTYLISPGSRTLREQIVQQGLSCGLDFSPDEVIITNGCQEALFLSLMTLCAPGDTVVLESPIYFSLINLLQQLKLKIIEIPAADDEGISLSTLRFVLENHPVKAMFSIPNFNNPMGFTLPLWKKKKLVQLLSRYRVPLIEDDIYGDLCFGQRPEPCKVFDTRGEVILCSSFSKTIAPGLRVGWMMPGKYAQRVNRLKTLINIATAPINQIAVARFLKQGGYKQHLRRVRRKLQIQMEALRAAVLHYFPAGTRVTRPGGGLFVWIELPARFNTDLLYRKAVQSGILFAPGTLFSIKERYNHHLRLNTGTWNPRVEKAVAELGRLCARMSDSRADARGVSGLPGSDAFLSTDELGLPASLRSPGSPLPILSKSSD